MEPVNGTCAPGGRDEEVPLAIGEKEVAKSAEEAGEPFVSATQDMQKDSGEDGTAEWVFDRIVDYEKEGGLFRVRWEAYAAEDDTWEPPDHLQRNTVVRFFRRVKSNPPTGTSTLPIERYGRGPGCGRMRKGRPKVNHIGGYGS